MIEATQESAVRPGANIKVIGVGGGGSNAINTMIASGVESVGFVAVNTDMQSLSKSLSSMKIQVGKELTKGLGAGADPDVGRDATLEDRHEIMEAVGDADMVFVTAGMGGGTGTGGAAVVAQIARELGALTVGVVTKPFAFEGRRRARHAEIGIERLRENVDTLLVIPNQRLLETATPDMSLLDAFKTADHVLLDAVRGISDIINIPGTVNVDFADVKTVMSQMGRALMGIGLAQGEGRAAQAAHTAISSPLLDNVDIEGATGVLINITASPSVGILELNEACSVIHEAAHEEANIIMGAVIDEQMEDSIRVTVIATGFPVDEELGLASSSMLTPRKSVLSNMQEELRALKDPHWGASRSRANPPKRSSEEKPKAYPSAVSAPLQPEKAPIIEEPRAEGASQETPPLPRVEAVVREPESIDLPPAPTVEPESSEEGITAAEVLIHGGAREGSVAPKVAYDPKPASSSVEDIPLGSLESQEDLEAIPQVSYLGSEEMGDKAESRVGASAFHVTAKPPQTSEVAEEEKPPSYEEPAAVEEEPSAAPSPLFPEAEEQPLNAVDLAADIEDSIDNAMFMVGGSQEGAQEGTDIDVPTFLRGQVKATPPSKDKPSSSH